MFKDRKSKRIQNKFIYDIQRTNTFLFASKPTKQNVSG